jgi:hypothetical protein
MQRHALSSVIVDLGHQDDIVLNAYAEEGDQSDS